MCMQKHAGTSKQHKPPSSVWLSCIGDNMFLSRALMGPGMQVIDEEGRDRTPKSMLGQPVLQAARLAQPRLGESFQAGGIPADFAGDAAWHESAAPADHASPGAAA